MGKIEKINRNKEDSECKLPRAESVDRNEALEGSLPRISNSRRLQYNSPQKFPFDIQNTLRELTYDIIDITWKKYSGLDGNGHRRTKEGIDELTINECEISYLGHSWLAPGHKQWLSVKTPAGQLKLYRDIDDGTARTGCAQLVFIEPELSGRAWPIFYLGWGVNREDVFMPGTDWRQDDQFLVKAAKCFEVVASILRELPYKGASVLILPEELAAKIREFDS